MPVSLIMVLIVSNGITPMKDEPEVHLFIRMVPDREITWVRILKHWTKPSMVSVLKELTVYGLLEKIQENKCSWWDSL